ncbi:MAG: DUF512 domain-containing protein [Bdellovibrionales bacterium]
MVNNALPKQFSSTIKAIEIQKYGLLDDAGSKESRFLGLAQAVILFSQFFDAHGNILVPDRIRVSNSTNDLSKPIPQQEMQSVQGQLFGFESPIVLLCDAYMRLGKGSFEAGAASNPGKAQINWGDISFALLHDVELLNEGGVLNGRVAAVQHILGGATFPSPAIPLPSVHNNDTLEAVVRKWLLNTFDFSEPGVAKVVDAQALQVPIGSAQNAAIPFVWNNCNQGCRFCYVDRGFSTVRYPRGWARSLDDIKDALNSYDANTRFGHPPLRYALMDWEPTEHPEFLKVLKLICAADPKAQVPILTHGGNLKQKLLKAIAEDDQLRQQVLFQVSLNSADPAYRKILMPGGRPEQHEVAIQSLPLMHDLGIQFDVSLVAATSWIPLEDIEHTIRYADKYEPTSYIRVALPAGTLHHNPKLLLSPEELARIDSFVTALRPSVKTAIIVTVGLLNRTGLTPTIEDVIEGSNADQAGIEAGSTIIEVNGKTPRSRTEALQLLNDLQANKMVVAVRDPRGMQRDVELSAYKSLKRARTLVDKKVGTWGILMNDDVDFSIFRRIAAHQRQYELQQPVLVTSSIMKPFLDAATELLRPDEKVRNLRIIAASNQHFGGNICVAGLLTHDDIAKAVDEQNVKGDGYFISSAMLSKGGFDLAGKHFNELRARLKKPVFPLLSLTSAL